MATPVARSRTLEEEASGAAALILAMLARSAAAPPCEPPRAKDAALHLEP